MHTASTATDTLDLLWKNYSALCEHVDLDFMSPETLDVHIQQKALVRLFRIAAWLARQGFFIAAWSLWEYYSRSVCQGLPNKEQKAPGESTVDWVARSLAANGVSFAEQRWFASANCLRNLIAHSGGRSDGRKAEAQLERSCNAFSGIETWSDGYVDLTHCHVVELRMKIESFIRETASQVDEAQKGGTDIPWDPRRRTSDNQ